MSQQAPSSFTAWRPVLYTTAGLATAYCTYLAISALSTGSHRSSPVPRRRSRTRLQRRNAVRRPDTSLDNSTAINLAFGEGSPEQWPVCVFSHEDYSVTFSSWDGLPSNEILQDELHVTPDELEHVLSLFIGPFLDCILVHLHTYGGDLPGFSSFRRALLTQDHDGLMAGERLFTHGQWQFPPWTFVRAVEVWLAKDSYDVVQMRREGVVDAHNTAAVGTLLRRGSGSAPSLETDETATVDTVSESGQDPSGQGLKALLYHIAEEEAKKKAYVHRGTRCDQCNRHPITGIRWHCINCPDYDLCSTCEAMNVHQKNHVFAKIQIPICTLIQPQTGEMQRPWYPGGVNIDRPALTASERTNYARLYNFDEAQIDAYSDQFYCLCTKRHHPKQNRTVYAIDKAMFLKAFVNENDRTPIATNYVYDRMFDFYDAEGSGLILFEDFLSGIDYILHPSKRTSNERTFKGFDSDSDGYISRADVVRMFRAKYVIHNKLILDNVLVDEAYSRAENREAERVLRSSQPISSLFSDYDVGMGEQRRPFNKVVDQFGDHQVLPHAMFGQPILPNGQTEMDVSFWEAVFDRHGRPDKLSELHPDFQTTLEARLQVRDRYIGAEALMLDGNTDRYLVRADNRGKRPFNLDKSSLEQEWSQDIARAKSEETSEPVNLVDLVGRDQAFEVSQAELDVGLDVLFQEIDEGLNELFDTLFADKEALAAQVRKTEETREHYRSQIDALVARRAAEEKDSKAPAQAKSELNQPPRSPTTLKNVPPQQVHDERLVRSRNPSPMPVQPSSSEQNPPPQVTISQPPATADAPRQIGQDELLVRLQEESVPTDHHSLARMEDDIRNQNLEDLLAAAGYSISEPSTRPSSSSTEDAQQDASIAPPRDSASLFVMADEPLPRTRTPTPPAIEPVQPLVWTPETLTSSPATTRSTQDTTEQDRLVREAAAETQDVSDVLGPTDYELAEWAMLDVYEAEMRIRRGPARINYEEFEEVLKAEEKLKGLVDSWLEWAAF